jgi:hypothetical protein
MSLTGRVAAQTVRDFFMRKIKVIPKRLIEKNKKKSDLLEQDRNKVRLQYPSDIRIYLAQKNKDMDSS